jgi:cbb3-type cytochrome oxidase maturation protein
MDIVIALVLVSLSLVTAALLFFVSRLREGDFDHEDRLSLLPLAEDETTTSGPDPLNEQGAPADTLVGDTLATGATEVTRVKEEEATHGSP